MAGAFRRGRGARPRRRRGNAPPPASRPRPGPARWRGPAAAAPVTSTVRPAVTVIDGQSGVDSTCDECNERAAPADRRAGRACGRLAAFRPLHGPGAVCARPGLLREHLPQVRPAAAARAATSSTAPEMCPLFGQALAVQVGEALQHTGTTELWEFGAGSGALARELLQALGARVQKYTIVDLSAALRERQQQALAGFAGRVAWVGELPQAHERRDRRQRGARRHAGEAAGPQGARVARTRRDAAGRQAWPGRTC